MEKPKAMKSTINKTTTDSQHYDMIVWLWPTAAAAEAAEAAAAAAAIGL